MKPRDVRWEDVADQMVAISLRGIGFGGRILLDGRVADRYSGWTEFNFGDMLLRISLERLVGIGLNGSEELN